jgi:integrase
MKQERGLKQLPSGSWQITYYGPHACRTKSYTKYGKRFDACPSPCPTLGTRETHRETFDTYGDARKALNDRRSAVDNGEALPDEGKPETLETLLTRLETDHATKHRKAPLKLHHLRAAFAGKPARAILHADRLRAYVRDRQASGAADSTITQELANLRRAANLAGLSWPRDVMPKVSNVREGYFTPAELAQLLTLLPDWLAAAAEFAALTGWRAGNVFGLLWEHVDLKRGTVRAPAGTTKTGKPLVRHFDVSSRLTALLRAQERTHGPDVSPRVFERHDMRTAWSKAVGPDGLDKWCEQHDPRTDTVQKYRPTFHTLRHTFRQIMAQAGVDETDIMELGGWKTRATFDRYYDADAQAQRAAAKRQEAYMAAERAAAPVVIDLKRRKEA